MPKIKTNQILIPSANFANQQYLNFCKMKKSSYLLITALCNVAYLFLLKLRSILKCVTDLFSHTEICISKWIKTDGL